MGNVYFLIDLAGHSNHNFPRVKAAEVQTVHTENIMALYWLYGPRDLYPDIMVDARDHLTHVLSFFVVSPS